jgi:hypothetical protein
MRGGKEQAEDEEEGGDGQAEKREERSGGRAELGVTGKV